MWSPSPATTTSRSGCSRILGSLGLVDLDTPPEIIAGGVAGLRIFAGYAGWSKGQLEREVD